jgi:uncharacterized protein
LHLRISTGKKQFRLNWNKIEKKLYVEIKSDPQKGRANKEIIKELKKFFGSEVKIVLGLKSKEKIVEISSSEKEILEKFLIP